MKPERFTIMYIHTKRMLMASILLLGIGGANAGTLLLSPPLSTTAEACRQAAMQLDWLSQNQSRKDCSINLSHDALNVYYASKYILANELANAQPVLNAAIIQTNFIIDVGCDGQASIQAVLVNLQSILQAIS